jgi:hypothetical protein
MTTVTPLSKKKLGITRPFLALMVFLLFPSDVAKSGRNWWGQTPSPVVHDKVMPFHWWEEVQRSCERYDVCPFFAAAVMRIEGNGWTEQRIGSSPYWGPMGINENCPVPYRVLTNPLSNIRVGVAALRGDDRRTVLKRYNAEWYKDNYIRDILALERQLEREARVEVCLAIAVKGIKNDKDKPKHFSKRKREKTRQVASKSTLADNVGADAETRYTANGIVGG